MSTANPTFALLIRQSRTGDSEAAAQLVKLYEPALRREVRMIHTDPNLKRVMDASDLVQSVLGNFFIRLAAGQFEIEDPKQLVKLLAKMVKNKILNYERSENKRTDLSNISAITGDFDCPSEIVAKKELLETVNSVLTHEERSIADLRTHGESWQAVAERLGGNPDALRKQYARAMNRVAQKLELDEFAD